MIRLEDVMVQRDGTVRERAGQKRIIGHVEKKWVKGGSIWVTQPPLPDRCWIREHAVYDLVNLYNNREFGT